MLDTDIANVAGKWEYSADALALEWVLDWILSGTLGVGAMTLIMMLFSKLRVAEGNMILAMGSLITKKEQNSFSLGLVMHLSGGVFFAILYSLVLIRVPEAQIGALPAIGLGLGLIHGLVFSSVLITSVADFHPHERFRSPSVSDAVSHVLGHCVFGFVVASCYLIFFSSSLAKVVEAMSSQLSLLLLTASIFSWCLFISLLMKSPTRLLAHKTDESFTDKPRHFVNLR